LLRKSTVRRAKLRKNWQDVTVFPAIPRACRFICWRAGGREASRRGRKSPDKHESKVQRAAEPSAARPEVSDPAPGPAGSWDSLRDRLAPAVADFRPHPSLLAADLAPALAP